MNNPITQNKFRFALIFILICLPIKVFACKCHIPEPDELLKNTALIFRGKVVDIETEYLPFPSEELVEYRRLGLELPATKHAKFKMLVSYKGPTSDEIQIGYSNSPCGGYRFQVGEEITVFATGNSRDGFKTSSCAMYPYNYHSEEFHPSIESYRSERRLFISKLHKSPQNWRVLKKQAAFFVKYNDYEEAETTFNRLLQIGPKDLPALIGRADARYQQGAYELALADYQEIQKLDNQNSAARHGKTFALLKLGRTQELGEDRDFSGYENESEHPSFVGLNLVGANFRGAKLKGIDFSSANLTNSDFSEADIRNCSFIGAKLSHAKFRNLKSAYQTQFNHADLQHTDFSEADLVLANFDNATLDNADFSKANMEYTSFEGASIKNAKLNGRSLVEAKLRNLQFLDHDLSGMDLRGADLRGSTFRRTNLNGTAFGAAVSKTNGIMLGEMTNLQGADLSEANLSHVDWGVAIIADCRTKLPSDLDLTSLPVFPVWTNCDGIPPKTKSLGGYPFRGGPVLLKLNAQSSFFADQEFSGFRFWQSDFDNSDFSHATLIGLDIQGGSYQKANFEYANLTNAHFTAVNFTEASFAHADLSNVKLREVDFSSANLEDVQLTGLCFDTKSKWPQGFDPLYAGAKICN